MRILKLSLPLLAIFLLAQLFLHQPQQTHGSEQSIAAITVSISRPWAMSRTAMVLAPGGWLQPMQIRLSLTIINLALEVETFRRLRSVSIASAG